MANAHGEQAAGLMVLRAGCCVVPLSIMPICSDAGDRRSLAGEAHGGRTSRVAVPVAVQVRFSRSRVAGRIVVGSAAVTANGGRRVRIEEGLLPITVSPMAYAAPARSWQIRLFGKRDAFRGRATEASGRLVVMMVSRPSKRCADRRHAGRVVAAVEQ